MFAAAELVRRGVEEPLLWLYRRGPRALGFWAGKDDAEVCAELTGVRFDHWVAHAADCEERIRAQCESWVVLLLVALYMFVLFLSLRGALRAAEALCAQCCCRRGGSTANGPTAGCGFPMLGGRCRRRATTVGSTLPSFNTRINKNSPFALLLSETASGSPLATMPLAVLTSASVGHRTASSPAPSLIVYPYPQPPVTLRDRGARFRKSRFSLNDPNSG